MLEQPRRDKAAAELQVKSHRFVPGLPPFLSPPQYVLFQASFVLHIAVLANSIFLPLREL